MFEELPMAVFLQEAHMPSTALPAFRRTVHAHLPLYCVFAARTKRQQDRIQVITLIHVQAAARASLLDISQELKDVCHVPPELHLQAHFLRLIDPRSNISFLLANIRQFQASEPIKQSAMLAVVHNVLRLWTPQSDHVLIAGDYNARRYGRALDTRIFLVSGKQTRAFFSFHQKLVSPAQLQSKLRGVPSTSLVWQSSTASFGNQRARARVSLVRRHLTAPTRDWITGASEYICR
jgi:hypothetical protein